MNFDTSTDHNPTIQLFADRDVSFPLTSKEATETV